MYNVQDYGVLYNNVVPRSYVRIGVLLTCRKHLRDPIISLRGEVWEHIKLILPRNSLLKCPFQARKMSGHVFV